MGRRGVGKWVYWIEAWIWALAGLILGALVAPSLVQFAGLSGSPYQDWLVIGIAALAAFLAPVIALLLLVIPVVVLFRRRALKVIPALLVLPTLLLPIPAVGYGIYRYLTLVGPGQRHVTIAFVGGLLIKTFLFPLIKGIVTGALFRWFMGWLRGGKVKSA